MGFYIPAKYDLDYRDDIVHYYSVDDLKRELGWNTIHGRTGYFEKILEKYNDLGSFWSVLEQNNQRMLSVSGIKQFIQEYVNNMPRQLKNKKEYWVRAQAALKWINEEDNDFEN